MTVIAIGSEVSTHRYAILDGDVLSQARFATEQDAAIAFRNYKTRFLARAQQ